MKNKKHIHFIGIVGKAIAPLAVLYKKMGYTVSGSDRGFFPPMSTYLEKNGIKIMPGYKREHLVPRPDVVNVMAFLTKKNPEVKEAIRQKIPIHGYAEILSDILEKKESFVVVGDHGKTTISALISWGLEVAGKNPSFMVAGTPLNFGIGIRKTNSRFSVLEGDEYPVLAWKKIPKFLCYNPKYLIIPDIRWDHMGIYPTYKSYVAIFQKLVKKIPSDGVIVAYQDSPRLKKLLQKTRAKVLWYSSASLPRSMTRFFTGNIWRENAAAAYVALSSFGVKDDVIAKSFRTFVGVEGRQQIRYEEKRVVVVDDFAHTPVKVAGSLQSMRERFSHSRILAVYEPGERSEEAIKQKEYTTCFQDADAILLPHVSAVEKERRDFSKRLYERYGRYYKRRISYVDNDKDVLEAISSFVRESRKRVVVVFMSQRGFRGMIEETVRKLKEFGKRG